jgi:murein hydrolase activator
MTLRKLAPFLLLIAGAFLASTAPAHGDLGGIGADVELARMLDEIESDTAKQARLAEEHRGVDVRRGQTSTALKLRVRAMYRVTRPGMAPVAGGFDAVRIHVARVRRLSNLIRDDLGQLKVLQARSATLKAEQSLLEGELQRARERLATLQQHGSQRDVMADLGASTPSLPSIGAAHGGFYGIRFSDEQPSDGFESLRGRLVTPVAGEMQVVDARRTEGDGPGLELRAPAGTLVRAAAAGRVAFSDRYGSYGRLVILDHGDGYYTAYGGLGSVEVRVGDDLSAHARLGTVGGESSPSALFFEVRKGTRTLPPRAWLGL